jgi:hypothetical protein
MLNATQNLTHWTEPASAAPDRRLIQNASPTPADRAGLFQFGTPALQISRPLYRLDRWLGLSRFTQREWSSRLPAVAAAGVALAAYAWGAGLEPISLPLTLLLGLAAAIVGLYSDSK